MALSPPPDTSQDLAASSRDGAALRSHLEEARAAKLALAARTEELSLALAQLQAVVGELGSAAARGERESAAELAAKVGRGGPLAHAVRTALEPLAPRLHESRRPADGARRLAV
jgi:ABC-type transporter Mla subunit MlaD